MAKWISILTILMFLMILSIWVYKKMSADENVVLTDSVKLIVLHLNQIYSNEEIHPTRLLDIDESAKEVIFEIKLPSEGWKRFKGKEGEQSEGGYYFIKEVHGDHVVVIVQR